MTASERLSAWLREGGHVLEAIGPTGLAINLGMSMLVVTAGLGASIGLRRAVRYGVRRFPGPSNAEKHVRGARTLRLTSALLNVLIGGVAVLAVGAIWGIDLAAQLAAGAGLGVTQSVVRALLVLVGAVVAIESSGFVINQAVHRLVARSGDSRRAAQLSTFGPLLRGTAHAVIVVLAALTLLGDLGIRIGPLLAGAGVVGVALGFGAQTVVRDLLTGLFLLIEDVLAVGDIVRIAGHGGLVESITLRTIRLRDFDGTLHVIPFGEAQLVHNLTKTFSYYVFELHVSYASDLDEALRLMRKTGEDLFADPDYRGRILERIEVVGVDSLAARGVVLKARIKTRPLEQWNVGREYNRRIKLAFDRGGVEMSFPDLKVRLQDDQMRDFAGAFLPRSTH